MIDIYSWLMSFLSVEMISAMGDCAFQRLLFIWGFFVPAVFLIATLSIPVFALYVVFRGLFKK